MAGSFVINSPNATVTFSFTDTIERVQSTIENCANWLYLTQPTLYEYFDTNGHPVLFTELSAQQKVNIVNKFIAIGIMDVSERNKAHLASLVVVNDGTTGLGE